MPRALLLSTALGPGGAETQVVRLALELRRFGWEVALASLLPLPDASERKLPGREDGITVFSLGMPPGMPDPRGLTRLAWVLSRFRPAILHCHMFHANLLGRMARLFCPVPVVISTLHTLAETPRAAQGQRAGGHGTAAPGFRDFCYRVTGSLADVVVAVSHGVAERHTAAGAVRKGRLRVIPNGVDTAVFRPDSDARSRLRRELGLGSRFVWLAAGRLMWKKDYPTLLRAVAEMESRPVLLIAGEGPQKAELTGLAQKLGVDARFLGRLSDIPSLMNAADALALSSVVEGLPMALLEAAACGLPAVATNAGGSAEVVVDGETGFVTPPGDARALAAAMRRIEALPQGERARMAGAARRRAVERFGIAGIAAQWDALYRELLENSRWM